MIRALLAGLLLTGCATYYTAKYRIGETLVVWNGQLSGCYMTVKGADIVSTYFGYDIYYDLDVYCGGSKLSAVMWSEDMVAQLTEHNNG